MHILNQTYIESGVINISCMLCMCYSSSRSRKNRKRTKKNQWGIVKTGGLQRKCLKSIKPVSTFSAKLSCALVLASHHGGHWHLGQVHG